MRTRSQVFAAGMVLATLQLAGPAHAQPAFQVRDIGTAIDVSQQGADFAVMEGVLYFPFSDGIHGTEVWRSDGTEAGTRMVKDYDTAAVADRVTAWSASAAEHCCDSSAALASSKAHCGQRRENPPFWSLNSTG